MDLVVAVLAFKRHLKTAGYAQSTIENYLINLDRFKQYLVDRDLTDLRQVTHQTLAAYQEQVVAEALAAESKANRLRPVKRLFEHLTDRHKLLINPAEGIVETCRKNRKVGTVLDAAEVRNLLDQPNLSLNTHIRDRVILEVLYATGIRLRELLGLEVYDADLKETVLYIRKGKGGRQRVVPLGVSAARWLKEYLEKIRPRHAKRNPKERTLFLNHHGQPMSPDSVRQLIRGYRLAAGIKKTVSPHTLRRTCATHMLQQGADIRYVQQLLGHRSLATTQQYTKVIPVDVKDTHKRTHPNVKAALERKENENGNENQ